jgi:hypothetical protein
MPKTPPGHGSAPHRRHVPSSAIASFIDDARVDAILAPWIEDPQERAFVVRCLLREGPAHHRGSNFVLLALLGQLVEAGGRVEAPAGGSARAVPLRLPPHLADDCGDKGVFPLQIPTAVIERLAPAGSTAHEAMIDCLTDGPPQHSLANAAMVCLIDILLRRHEQNGA